MNAKRLAAESESHQTGVLPGRAGSDFHTETAFQGGVPVLWRCKKFRQGSGRFANGREDWKWWHPTVPDKLRELYDDG